MKKIVILSDLQVPFEDVHVTKNIAKFLQSFKPDQTVTIGDEIDFQTISTVCVLNVRRRTHEQT